MSVGPFRFLESSQLALDIPHQLASAAVLKPDRRVVNDPASKLFVIGQRVFKKLFLERVKLIVQGDISALGQQVDSLASLLTLELGFLLLEPGFVPLKLGLVLFPVDERGADAQSDGCGQQQTGGGRGYGLVPLRPPPGLADHGLAPGCHPLIGHPPFDVLGQRPGRRVAICFLQRHGLETDSFQGLIQRGIDLSWPDELAMLNLAEQLSDIVTNKWRFAGQQAIERRAQAVDIGPRPQMVQPSLGLLGAHVSRRPHCRARQGLGRTARRGGPERPFGQSRSRLAHGLGKPPVHDQCLAVLAKDDIARFDVAVEDAATVCVLDGVADVDEPPQQLVQLEQVPAGVGLERLVGMKAVDGLLQAVAADKAHGVKRPAIGVSSQSVDRDDAGMLQPAGDLGLQQEPGAARGVVGVVVEDLLERHFPVQLAVERHEHSA